MGFMNNGGPMWASAPASNGYVLVRIFHLRIGTTVGRPQVTVNGNYGGRAMRVPTPNGYVSAFIFLVLTGDGSESVTYQRFTPFAFVGVATLPRAGSCPMSR